MARGETLLACARFAESERLDPAPGTLLNLADCEERAGKLASALRHVQEAQDQLPPSDFRLPFTQEQITRLTRLTPRLTVNIRPSTLEGASVTRDGVPLGPASLGIALPVDPGRHACTLHVSGYADRRVDVTLREGERVQVELEPGGLEATRTLGNEQAGHVVPSPPRRPPAAAYVASGVGLAAVALGTITGIMAIDAASTFRDHCDASGVCRDQTGLDAAARGQVVTVVSPIALAVGALGVGVGAYLLFARPAPRSVNALPSRAGVNIPW